MRSKIYLFIPVLIIITAYLLIIAQKKTIIPVDMYLISPELYQPGNGLKVRNHFLVDYPQLYLPWKYFLSQYHPARCTTEIGGPLQAQNVSGVRFPGGFCYPLGAVRPYTEVDGVFFFSRFTSFFTAYNLSYLFSTIFFYGSFCFFFWSIFFAGSEFTSEKSFLIALLSALAVTSFPFARDLQSDGLSQSIPYVVIALGLLRLSFLRSKIVILLSGVFLFLGIARSSLQALGFCPLFFFLFACLWIFPKEIKKKNLIALNLSVMACATLAGFIYNFSSVDLFLLNARDYIPPSPLSPLALMGKKILADGFAVAHFFLGDFVSSFSTVDFLKALGSLGARDYVSYDWTTFFINPMVSVFFALALASSPLTRKKILRLFAPVFVIDLLIVFLPTYRVLYFRFHQWWLVANILYIMGGLIIDGRDQEFSNRKIGKALFSFLTIILSFFILVKLNQARILSKLGHQGVLGFEPGYWNHHVDDLLRFLSFRNFYSLTFISGFMALYLLRKKLRWQTLLLVTVSGLLLNTFFINFPQSTEPFYEYQIALAKKLNPPKVGYLYRDNVKLLINERPCSFYESLYVLFSCN